MLIGIDAHNLEGNRTGVGRYLFSLLKEWAKSQIAENESQAAGFILYFKDKIPSDLSKSDLFESKLLKTSSTAKFIHWDLCRAARKDRVNILFCPGYIAPIFYKGKIALALHDIIYEAHPDWFNWQSLADKIFLKLVSKISARKAEIIFTPSEFSRHEVIKHYGVAPEKVIFIPDAAQMETTDSVNDAEEIKKRYSLKEKFGFYIGSIFNRRHLPEIMEAFLKIAREEPEFQFLLSGKDHTKPEQDIGGLVEEINKKLGRQAILKIDFVPENDLKLLYGACAFFIWLSDYEGFGFPVLEAMSLGAPVITSQKTSLIEVAGEAAYFIKDNSNVKEIQHAMAHVLKDDGLRKSLAEKGKKQAEKFSWGSCAKETLEYLLKAGKNL